jgi:putative nucleotidyltransferase with HDIG domain
MNLLETLREFMRSRSTPAYLVGGTVRDMLLNRPTRDIDLSVSGNASRLARAFADDIGAAYYLMDESFDVARVIQDHDGAREIVDMARIRGESIVQDLETRDFTVNAMAADLLTWQNDPADLIDPFDGRADLTARRVRALSDRVFKDDPVRLLRAARMEAELDMQLDDLSADWVRRDAPLLRTAPMERVRDELMKIIASDNVLRNLRRLDSLGLLENVFPELGALRGVTQSSPHVYPVFEHSLHAAAAEEATGREGYSNLAEGAFGAQLTEHFSQRVSADRTRRDLLRLALLLHDLGKPATRVVDGEGRIRFFGHEDVGADMAEQALRRLKFSNDEIEVLTTMVKHHMRPLLLTQSGVSNRAIYRYFRDTGDVGVDIAVHSWCDRQATYGADADAQEIAALQAVIGRLLDRYYHARAQVIAPPALLSGSQVMQALGLPPGPRIGLLLDALREAQAEGIVTTRDDALEFVKKFDPPA